MLCYKDMTFCNYFLLCKKGYSCHRALTNTVMENAKKADLPLAVFYGEPECLDLIWCENEERDENVKTSRN